MWCQECGSGLNGGGGAESHLRPCRAETAALLCLVWILEQLCVEREPARGMRAPGDLVWARRLLQASLPVLPSPSKKPKMSASDFTSVCLEKWSAPLWSAVGTSVAQQTGLFVASWHSLVLANPQLSPGKEGDLR